jgi:hypothetical protein
MSLSRRVGALQYQLDAIAAGQGASRVGSSSLSSPVPSGSTAGHTGASQINPYTYGNPTNGAGNFPTSSIPQNQYHVGQVVNPGTGEYITGSTYDPVYGWLNETNLGGVYTSGGSRSISTTPFGGSYLGYLSSLKTSNPAQYAVESKSPFHFAGAPRVNNTTGAYALTSTAGGTYNF